MTIVLSDYVRERKTTMSYVLDEQVWSDGKDCHVSARVEVLPRSPIPVMRTVVFSIDDEYIHSLDSTKARELATAMLKAADMADAATATAK